MTKFEVRLSDEFEISGVEVDSVEVVKAVSDVSIAQRTVKVREKLAFLSVAALGASLAIATWIGFNDGSYNEVVSVWAAGAVPLGFVLRAYFDKG
ncbi:MAG: hypothetical protein EOP66_05695 [Sphingomonas sp.]|nr:MAG: hypothetical protein EOP66_05695 [Sphingomonas sp.]